MIINSDPSICYLNSDNSSCMQLIVTAHAAIGHNHFFKHNYLFKEHTNAKSIVDYMCFARDYIKKCEIKYGFEEVEYIIDLLHLLRPFGVFKSKNILKSKKNIKEREKKIINYYQDTFNPLINNNLSEILNTKNIDSKRYIGEENILYFIEKITKKKTWIKELIRIIRNIEQYFYPQLQTKVMNEGFAQFVEKQIFTDMYDLGIISEEYMMEYIQDNGGVMYQADSTGNKRKDGSLDFNSINPYYLGYKIFEEIKRVCENPTDLDYKETPRLAGKNWIEEINYAIKNFRDDSFILQYLTPNLIRKLRLLSNFKYT